MPIHDRQLNEYLDNLLEALEKKELADSTKRDDIKDLVKKTLDARFGSEGAPHDLLTSKLGHKIMLQLVVGANLQLTHKNNPPGMQFHFAAFATALLNSYELTKSDPALREKFEKSLDKTLCMTLPMLAATLPKPGQPRQGPTAPRPTPGTGELAESKKEFEDQLQLFSMLYGITPEGNRLVISSQMTDSMGITQQPGSQRSMGDNVSGIVAELYRLANDRQFEQTGFNLLGRAMEAVQDCSYRGFQLGKEARGPVPPGPM